MAASSTPKVLTAARDAVWQALREWPLYTETIRTFCDTDAAVKDFLRQEANVSRCPMLSALWRTTNPEWWVHSQQEWKCPLEISLWLPDDRQSLAESLLEDVIDAVYRAEHTTSVAGGRVFIVQKECGTHPQILALEIGVPIESGQDGKHRLFQSSVVVQLSLRKRPIMALNS